MVGAVPARAFEDDPNRVDEAIERTATARAVAQRLVLEALAALQLRAAGRTSVDVEGHRASKPPSSVEVVLTAV
jgi:hypothetical protein